MGSRRERTKSRGDVSASMSPNVTDELRIRAERLSTRPERAVLTPASFLSVARPDPSPTCPPPTGIVVTAPPPGTTGDKEAIVDEATVIKATVIKVTVIDEVSVIEVTVIEPTAGNHGTTMDARPAKPPIRPPMPPYGHRPCRPYGHRRRRTRPRRQHGQALQCRYGWYS